MLKYIYGTNAISPGSATPGWAIISSVTAINLAQDYCDPFADSCTGLTQNWPSVSYVQSSAGANTLETITDPLGRVSSVTSNSSSQVVGLQRPMSATNNVTYVYNSNGYVSSATNDGVAVTYAFSLSGTVMTAVATDATGHTRTIVTDQTVGLPSSVTDERGRKTSYNYDANGRISRLTRPELDYVSYSYDTRGNITQTTSVSKTAGTPANISTSAGYDLSCTNAIKCNQPNWTKNVAGNQTDFSYDPTTGLPVSVTAPAMPNGIRPQSRFIYTSTQAYYKNSSGMIAASGLPIQLITQISSCMTTASCTGTSDESQTNLAYGVVGVANNLFLTNKTLKAGDGSLSTASSVGFDNIGNIAISTDALGSATNYKYDQARQITQVISSDPDGSGPLKNRSVVIAYNLDGKATSVSRGTSNSDGSGFSAFLQGQTTYDANGRRATDSTVAGGAISSLNQFSYDSLGRLSCSAKRMNPATYSSLPASACTLATAGAFGSDRITQTNYSPSAEVLSIVTGLNDPTQRTLETLSYNANGTLQSLADGNGNLTSYVYDGFDRLTQTQYPTAGNGSVSNSADYDGNTYDSIGRLSSVRRRSGEIIYFTYDNLMRIMSKTVPEGGDSNINYKYDNLGRLISAFGAASGTGFATSFDSLGRRTTSSTFGQALTYGYDLNGARTLLTYPDGFYVSYDYDSLGELTKVRENGATSGVGLLATYNYDDWGRIATGGGVPALSRGNTAATNVGYDSFSRLASISHTMTGTAVNYTFGGYNPANEIGNRNRDNDAFAWSGAVNVNRGYAANGLNQYITAGAASISYDTKGDLASDGSNNYSYSSENRMTSSTGANSGLLSYDPLGRLRTTSGGTSGATTYLYDGDSLVAEYGPGNTLLRRYVHGAGIDVPLVWYEGAGTADRRWLHADERGSVIAISNASGGLISSNSYDEYGIPGASNLGRFGYTGQIYLADQGMFYYKSRIYSPTLGRFMQPDPIGYGDGPNWYNYVGSNSINDTDPSGMNDYAPVTNEDSGAGLFDTGAGFVGGIVVNGHNTCLFCSSTTDIGSIPGLTSTAPGLLSDNAPEEIVVTAKKKTPQSKLHKYTINLLSPCSAKSVFDYFKGAGHSAPGAPAASEGTHNLTLTGNNPIRQDVNSATGTIVNTTLPGHQFYPGTVTIQVTPLGRETSTITVTGEGTGAHPILNDVVGQAWFGGTANGASDACGRW